MGGRKLEGLALPFGAGRRDKEGVRRGGPLINRQPTWPHSRGQSMHLPADSCTSLGGGVRSDLSTLSTSHKLWLFPSQHLALGRGLFRTHNLRGSSPHETFPCIDLVQQLPVCSANSRGAPAHSDSAPRAGVRTQAGPGLGSALGCLYFAANGKQTRNADVTQVWFVWGLLGTYFF